MKKILLFFIALNVNAGILLDPYLSLRTGSYEANDGRKWSYDGPLLGARIGYNFPIIMTGLDYSFGSTTFSKDSTGVTDNGDYDQKTIGLFVGARLPMIRGWLTYYLSQTLEDIEGNGKGEKYKGNGIGYAVGYTGLPFVSLNIEYRKYTYDELEGGSNSKLDDKSDELVLSISAPFDI